MEKKEAKSGGRKKGGKQKKQTLLMKYVVLNIRGIGNKDSLQQLWYMVQQNHLNLVVIIEPKKQLESFFYYKLKYG